MHSKIYERHNQENVIGFVNYFVEKFPFCIHTTRTRHGHEFKAEFRRHVTHLCISPLYFESTLNLFGGLVQLFPLRFLIITGREF